jgi:PKD repeat protein
MEIYGNDPACRNAVNAFMNGWVERMHEFGNLAGVYGATGVSTPSGCSSGLADYLTNPNVPDVIWPARWYLPAGVGTYDPTASVWDVGSCIPSNAWSNHQRIRQYAGDHAETWGGLRMPSIDSDVMDGVVSVPYFGTPSPDFTASPFSGPPLTIQFTITNTAFMSSCSWNYGDGQTSNSCSYNSTHTYNHAGMYMVSLTVRSPWGAENLTSSETISVNYHIYLPWMIQ